MSGKDRQASLDDARFFWLLDEFDFQSSATTPAPSPH
jgi:hypothetical protein